MENVNVEEKKNTQKSELVKTIIGIALCIIFGFMLVCNMVIIVKGAMSDERPPSIFGTTPLVVLSGSMSGDAEGHIEIGDLVFLEDAAWADLKEGDVVTFKDGGAYTTHRLMRWEKDFEYKDKDGNVLYGGWVTKGDYNNGEDSHRLVEASYIGRVTGRVPFIGNVILFLQTPLGMILCVGVPLALYIGIDIFLRKKADKSKVAAAEDKTTELEDKNAALMAELERLRALAGEQNNTSSSENKDGE